LPPIRVTGKFRMDEEKEIQESRWLAYVTSLPTDDPPARMRIMRTLDGLGCAVIREGVYLLPDTPGNRQSLSSLSDHIIRMSGRAYLLPVISSDQNQAQLFRGHFDRTRKYNDLIKNVESLKAGFGISDPAAITRLLSKQRQEFENISSLDFFPSDTRDRAAQTLREIEEKVHDLMFPDTPDSAPQPETGVSYFKRLWATRRPLGADRLASGWLIRRFIDPEATLIWLDKGQECPQAAVAFGFEGATFSNSARHVTFERLLSSFGLEKNSTLARIGTLVHFLEAGGTPVPEAPGVETMLQGAKRRTSDEDELFAECEKTFDLLYEAYFEPPGKA